jgi:hypothetical protein
MSNISLDFDRLLGFKVTWRALQAMQIEAGQQGNGQEGENDPARRYSAILRSRIGVKGVTGLRYRSAA